MASQYEVPDLGGPADKLLGFLLESVQEANGWLQSQRPSTEWSRVLEMFAPSDPSRDINGLSNTGFNLVERNARDIVASLSDFRFAGDFRPTFDQELYNQAHMLTQLDQHWERTTFAHEAFRANLQNTVAFGTGYLVQDFDKDFHGAYGDVRLRAFGPQDVTFVQLPRDHNIQKAYMVLIREEMPINLARYIYPNIANHLTPDRDAPGWIQRGLQKVQSLMGGSPALRVAGNAQRNQQGSFPTVDIFHAYVMDRSVNRSGQPMSMGTRGTNWRYTVPSLGDAIPIGQINPATGQSWTRPAEEHDCRMFPLRRYCIFSRTAVAYDGSSPWWHGAVPVARTRFNDWAWEALGKSLLGDVKTMQDGIVAIMRYVEDACAARLDPPALYDDTLVSEGFAKNFNPRMAGVRARADLNTGGKVIDFPVDVSHYEVPTFITEFMRAQEERINHQMGVTDLVAMAKARQVPGEGTLEKLMEMAGPLVDDMVRSQEVPYQQLGEWRKAYFLQFYTYGRIIQIAGPDGLPEDVQFTPDMLVPYIAGETADARQNRTRELLSQFRYHQTESSINERHRLQNKLALLQLKKAGVPIDRWTIYKAWQLPNPGPEPEGTNNMQERIRAEHLMDLEQAEEVAKMQVAAQGGNPVGRPPSNTGPARLETKDGGTRTTLATS